MDTLSVINAGVCLLMACGLGWLIMAPTVPDGIVIKLGLILAALGLLGCALVLGRDVPDWRALMVAWLLVHVGALVVVGGLVLRVLRDPTARAVAHAVSGWPPLGDPGERS